MLLAIDARNRAITVGFYERSPSGMPGKGVWLSRRRLGAVLGRSADEYAMLLRAFASEAGGAAEAGGVDSAWMSSVAPSLSRELAWAVSTAFGLSCQIVGPGVRTGVRIRSDQPSEVGSDLICAAAAARELVGGACVIVDFDAAIAFSAIGRAGDFLGAAIAPGIGTSTEALRSAAALLPEVTIDGPHAGRPDDPWPAIGKSTSQAVKAGLAIGFAGLVERIVRRQREEIAQMGEADSPETVSVIGTGDGEGRLLFAALGLGRFVPDLALHGLAIVAERAAPAPRPLA